MDVWDEEDEVVYLFKRKQRCMACGKKIISRREEDLSELQKKCLLKLVEENKVCYNCLQYMR